MSDLEARIDEHTSREEEHEPTIPPNKTMDDKRSISGLLTTTHFISGETIIPYEETGEGAYIAWFAIYENGEITRRVNSKYVIEIIYDNDEPDEPTEDIDVLDALENRDYLEGFHHV